MTLLTLWTQCPWRTRQASGPGVPGVRAARAVGQHRFAPGPQRGSDACRKVMTIEEKDFGSFYSSRLQSGRSSSGQFNLNQELVGNCGNSTAFLFHCTYGEHQGMHFVLNVFPGRSGDSGGVSGTGRA